VKSNILFQNKIFYLASNGLAVKVERKLFPPVLVDFGLDLLPLLLSVVTDFYINWRRKAEKTLLKRERNTKT
jgi:hypothetical protein